MSLASVLLLLAVGAPPDAIGPLPSAAPAPPDPVARLVGALARLPATSPVRARVEHKVAITQGDEEQGPAPGTASAVASSGPEGLRITWSPALLAQADAEERARIGKPDAEAPTRDAILDLRTLSLARVLDAVPELLRDLADAKLLEDRLEIFEGAPRRMLKIEFTPVVPARDRRYVKDVEATARIWLGPDGIPVAAERTVVLHGRIFLIIGFEIEQRDALRFGRSGDRLVVLRQESDSRSSGAGERRDRHARTALTLLD
jgi:hypothetical protein